MKSIILSLVLVSPFAQSALETHKFTFKGPSGDLVIPAEGKSKEDAFHNAAMECFSRSFQFAGESEGLDAIDICANPIAGL